MQITVHFSKQHYTKYICEARMISPSEKMLALQQVSKIDSMNLDKQIDIVFIPMKNILKIDVIEDVVKQIKTDLRSVN